MSKARVLFYVFSAFFLLGFFLVGITKGEETKVEGYLRWVDDRGVVHITDDWKQVPDRFKDRVQQGTWEGLEQETNKHWSISESVPVPKPRPIVEEEAAFQAEATDSCQPFHTKIEWKEFDGYMRRYYVLVDACGKERGYTLDSEPEIKTGIND